MLTYNVYVYNDEQCSFVLHQEYDEFSTARNTSSDLAEPAFVRSNDRIVYMNPVWYLWFGAEIDTETEALSFLLRTTQTYNGYPNWETWSVALYFDNNAEIREDLHYMVEEEKTVYGLSNRLRTYCQDGHPMLGENSIYAQLLLGALSEVDWFYIAELYWEEKE